MRALPATACPVLLLSGCVAWSSGPAPEAPLAGAERVRANLSLETTFHVDVEGVKPTEEQEKEAAKDIEEVIAEVFGKSGRYKIDRGDSAYTLEVDVTNSGDPNMLLALISGATLCVIPAWATDSYVTDVQLFDATRAPVESTRFVHDQTVLIQILLLPATPFAFPSSVNRRMWRNVSEQMVVWTDKTILAHAAKARLAPPAAPSPAPAPAAPRVPDAVPPPAAPAAPPAAEPAPATPAPAAAVGR
jgi:hypothetical protein